MRNKTKTPQTFTDIPEQSWVDNWFPESWVPYAKAMRLDRPIGIWLLLIPGLWSIAMASRIEEMGFLLLVFTLGAIIMRGAGCMYNDLIDVDIDQMVVRTKSRPIASGLITFRQASVFIFCLLVAALFLLSKLSNVAIFLGFFALIPVMIYPVLKRFTYWPQAMLGIAFNWGALMGWAAAHGRLSTTAFLLYVAGFCWTMIYDTIYAHQDKEDDMLIGVKSTAIRFGDSTPYVLTGFAVVMFIFLYWVGFREHLSSAYFISIFLVYMGIAYQVMYLDYNNPSECLKAFKQQAWAGWLVLAGIFLGRISLAH